MGFSTLQGTTEPGQDGGLSNGSWMFMAGIADPNEAYEFSVDGGEPQMVYPDGETQAWDWDGPILDNGEHTIEWTSISHGQRETRSWTIEVDEDDQGRRADAQRRQQWQQSGRQAFRDAQRTQPRASTGGGAGGGGAGTLVTAGAGSAATASGAPEKANAQPTPEKDNPR